MSPRKHASTDEIRARLEEIRSEKRNRVRWQISHHTAELALSVIAGHARVMYRPGNKSRRRKRHKRLL
jgi:hypothetical protein